MWLSFLVTAKTIAGAVLDVWSGDGEGKYDVQRDDLARIRRSQRRLLTLVNDVLSFARIESAQLELHTNAQNLEKKVEQRTEELARGVAVPHHHLRREERRHLVLPVVVLELQEDGAQYPRVVQ